MQWRTKATTMVPKVYLHLHSVIKATMVSRGWDGTRSYRSSVEEEQLPGIVNLDLVQRWTIDDITRRKLAEV